MAKKIIRLTTAIGETVNNDPDVSDLLKVLAHQRHDACASVLMGPSILILAWMFLLWKNGLPMAGHSQSLNQWLHTCAPVALTTSLCMAAYFRHA